MANITFPDAIYIDLPSSIAPSLRQMFLSITSYRSPLSTTIHALHLLLKTNLFILRTNITISVIWTMSSAPLATTPITLNAALFSLLCTIITASILYLTTRVIASLPAPP
jgi:hypothetical protein